MGHRRRNGEVLPKRRKLDGPFTFISIALLRPEKRLDLLIKAFSMLSKQIPNIVLTIIGDGTEKDKLKLLSYELEVNNRINFIGYQKKIAVADILRDHDALVLSSQVETFGVVLVEAMSVGLPVIASDLVGINEVASSSVDSCFLVKDSNDISEWINKIELCISILEKDSVHISKESYQHSQKFSLEKMTKSYIDLYRQVLKNE